MKKIMLNLAEPAYPLPKFVQKELCEFLGKVHRLPRNYHELEKAIAGEFHVHRDNVLLANGADEAIDLIARAFGKKTLVFTPSYLEYALAPKRNGFAVERANALHGKEYSIDPRESKAKKATLIFLANPSNPFGCTERKKTEELIHNSGGVVAVDETHLWFSRKRKSLAPLVRKHGNLLVFGSFSKVFSLAGMRIGYIIAGKKLLRRIKGKALCFNVSALSVQAALLGLKHKKHFKKKAERTAKERKKFEGWLEERGFNVFHTENNNAVIKFPSVEEAGAFVKRLEKRGILVLQGNGISTLGLSNAFVRITIGNAEEMRAVREAISEIFPKSGI